MELDYAKPVPRRPMGREWLAVGAVLLTLGALHTFVITFNDTIYTRTVELDLSTGRQRVTHTILGFQSTGAAYTTGVSSTLTPSDLSVQPDWHPVQAKQLIYVHTNCCAFGDAPGKLRSLEALWQLHPFSTAAKRQSAVKLLACIKADGDSNAYLNRLMTEVERSSATRPSQPFELTAVPK